MSLIKNIKKPFHIDIHYVPNDGNFVLPDRFFAFIGFFWRQIKWLLILIASLAAIEAIFTSLTYWYLGEIVKQQDYTMAFVMVGIGIVAGRFISVETLRFSEYVLYWPHFGNMVRRQCFHYTARHSLAYFQNDFAGRIANKLLQCGNALRDATLSIVVALVFVGTIFITNVILVLQVSFALALPQILWVFAYISILSFFLPKIKMRATATAESMSTLTGQIVDSFTNILAAKYFARTRHEDARANDFMADHSAKGMRMMVTSCKQSALISLINFLLIGSTIVIGIQLVAANNTLGIAALAMTLPMVIQTSFWSGWIMRELSGIFENLGTVQEGIDTLSLPHGVTDSDAAQALTIPQGHADIRLNNISFHYDQADKPVLQDFELTIPAGQKVGLVGHSGAGKSTITSLIVRAFDVNDGAIHIAGHNIKDVTQDSLRQAITVVTQDSYLFHRSVLDNIRYGKPNATVDEVIAAARKASAHDFIPDLIDNAGRTAYDAHVGERGVKLSGGQKQRISIARAILKNSPILILDEATSALDSESEAAIQNALESIMDTKTVIAIAHRLSTLRQMDRIIVMDHGKIVEDGTHDSLIAKPGGHYAKLWAMQSGGFLK